ncbi:MAG: hypothetical protein WKF84_15705 [Pyrinomonadaceae bacterium]
MTDSVKRCAFRDVSERLKLCMAFDRTLQDAPVMIHFFCIVYLRTFSVFGANISKLIHDPERKLDGFLDQMRRDEVETVVICPELRAAMMQRSGKVDGVRRLQTSVSSAQLRRFVKNRLRQIEHPMCVEKRFVKSE